MIKTIFHGLEFDVEQFAKSPKCTQVWYNEDTGAGCLLTAFWQAFGFKPEFNARGSTRFVSPCKQFTYCLQDMREETNILSNNLGLPADYQSSSGFTFDFSECVIDLFDSSEKMMDAVNLVWELIDKLPNKVNIVDKSYMRLLESCEVL